MTLNDNHNVIDILGGELDTMTYYTIVSKICCETVAPTDEHFTLCIECFDLFLAKNAKSWLKAMSANRLPEPLQDMATEIGDSCRPVCGPEMISNEKIRSICEYETLLNSSVSSIRLFAFQCNLTFLLLPSKKITMLRKIIPTRCLTGNVRT